MSKKTLYLNLDLCIATADLARIGIGKRPIKNINRLSLLIETRYDENHDVVLYMLYKASKKGYCQDYKLDELESIITMVCEVLEVDREQLVKEVNH